MAQRCLRQSQVLLVQSRLLRARKISNVELVACGTSSGGGESKVGDVLEIEYDGSIAESYPAQITKVYSIRVAE